MSNVAKKKPAEIVGIDHSMLELDSGLGNEEINQDVLGIPFLKTNLTPAVLDANRGALKGDMLNTVTGEICVAGVSDSGISDGKLLPGDHLIELNNQALDKSDFESVVNEIESSLNLRLLVRRFNQQLN